MMLKHCVTLSLQWHFYLWCPAAPCVAATQLCMHVKGHALHVSPDPWLFASPLTAGSEKMTGVLFSDRGGSTRLNADMSISTASWWKALNRRVVLWLKTHFSLKVNNILYRANCLTHAGILWRSVCPVCIYEEAKFKAGCLACSHSPLPFPVWQAGKVIQLKPWLSDGDKARWW